MKELRGPQYYADNSAGREIGETGEILQTDGDWELQSHDQDHGPVMLHVPCSRYVVDLNRGYPFCRMCGQKIPASMVNGFTMLNWGEIGNDEYFVPIKAELYDYEYYCLTRKRQALYDKGVDMKDTVFNNSDWFSMDDNITHFCGGMTDKDKVNKPKGTQVEATKWFNPTDKKKEEDEVLVCRACGAEHGPEDEVVLVGGK